MMKKITFVFSLLFLFYITEQIAYGQVNRLQAAVIIDNFGGEKGGAQEFLKGNIPITAAVIPFTEKSAEHAECAHQNGREVIIHLPIESKRGKMYRIGPRFITTGLSPIEVKERVYEAMKTVPYAKGFINTSSSPVIEEESIVRAIVEVAKEKKLYIVDSGTSTSSKFPEITQELGVPFLKRDVLLDDASSSLYVSKKMKQLAKIVEIKGWGIAMGHLGVTGRVCSAGIFHSMNEFKQRQIEIVPVSVLLTKK